jgi:hypothetical protein
MRSDKYKTDLATILLFSPQNAFSRELDIGVSRIDEHGRFSPQLKCEGGDVLGGGSGNNSAHAAAPREENVVPPELEEGGGFRGGAVDDAVRCLVEIFWKQVG